MPYKRDWRESTESAAKKGDQEAIAEMKANKADALKKLSEKDKFGAKANPTSRDTSNINKLNNQIDMLKSEVKKYEDKGYKNGGKVRTASQRADGCAIRGKTRAK